MHERLENHEQEKFVIQRMVVKIGSSTIIEGGTYEQPLNLDLITSIANQCSILFKAGVEVAIVSSGAVASGKSLLEIDEQSVSDRQIEAIFGQPALIHAWIEAFRRFGIIAGQILLTENDLKTPPETLKKALKKGVVVINANDAINSQEMEQFLVSADNDKLAGFVAKAIGADTLLILTDVDGVKDGNGCVIEDGMEINETIVFVNKSKPGTGGMASKVMVLQELAKLQIKGVIASPGEKIVLDAARGTLSGCTVFDIVKSTS